MKFIKTILKFLLGRFIQKQLDKEVLFHHFQKESKLDKWQKYAEGLVLESGIDTSNVLVHNFGQWGLCGKTYRNYTTHEQDDGEVYTIPIPEPTKPYIVVPEITGWWEFRAWLHELGHYTNGHYQKSTKTYIKEWEAEMYCIKMAERCPDVGWDLGSIKISARWYFYSHVIDAVEKGDLSYHWELDEEMKDFLFESNGIKEDFNTDFDKAKDKYWKKRAEERQKDLVV